MKTLRITATPGILSSPIEYLKGVGPLRADLLKKELQIVTFGDLLLHYPHRHIDRTQISRIADLHPETDFAQVSGTLRSFEITGQRASRRLVAELEDDSGTIELVWFQGTGWVQKLLVTGQPYLVYGRVGFYNGRPQIVHPEFEKRVTEQAGAKQFLEPVYPTTEKLKAKGLGGRQLGKLTGSLLAQLAERDVPEILPARLLTDLRLIGRYAALTQIHFPSHRTAWDEAVKRLKFEELFLAQLRLCLLRSGRQRHSKGVIFDTVGTFFNRFYSDRLPFALTGAQKRVIREIRADTARGHQMNRLLQGDVGSGKTIVALLIMLLAADNGFQSCLMAPTEILARQHYENIRRLLGPLDIGLALLTGSTKGTERKKILAGVAEGTIHLLVGTHAVIEDPVTFQRLGLVIIDEQHRFGVAQRARLLEKAVLPPHVLVMTATPIPRTLAMTAYGDLDYSVIDELPPGRQPITTVHRYDAQRSRVMEFLRTEIDKGRQAYVIFPLIEESEKMDYENLMRGYEEVKSFFPEPRYWISMVHGRQPAAQKEENMRRFVTHDTQIMVSTTVIEVGVDVPNASVMVIESAEKFGLSQLHQLRGRVGRGAEKSYCILMTGPKLGTEARERIQVMIRTQNGFEIAEKDLELRGPGEIEGTRQSGALNFRLAHLVQDRGLLEEARHLAARCVEEDPELRSPAYAPLRNWLQTQRSGVVWSRIA
ncbi:MAG: ATP-dependent helicase RecG [Bacteroidota bacterium]